MGVAVDETRKDGHVGEIDEFGSRGNGYILPDCLNVAVTNDDSLAGEHCTGIGVDQLASADGGNLRGCCAN
jgi:hypothetical protein